MEISITHTLSNPKLGNPGVTYRIYELINKAAVKNTRRQQKLETSIPSAETILTKVTKLLNKPKL